MLRDTRSYEVQIIDAVRAVNKALGGTYGTSPAIYKSEYNQYEVQLIDAIRGIGRTLSGSGLSLAGGGGVDPGTLQSLLTRVQRLENESFFRLDSGNVTLKTAYQNLWVPGWMSAGGVGSSGGGGGGSTVSISGLKSTGMSIATVTIDGVANTIKDGLTWGTYDDTEKTVTLTLNNQQYTLCVDGYAGGGGDYLPITGGTLTGDLRMKPTNSNYGSKIRFGDGDYVYLYEDTDDHLTIYANKGITLSTGSGYGIEIGNAKLIYDSDYNALRLTNKNGAQSGVSFYADGWVSAGGVGSSGQVATALGSLSDVSLSSPSNGQALVYRNGTWVNETIQGGGGGSTVSWGTPGADYVPLSVDGTTKNLLTAHQSLSGYVTLAGTPQTITGAKTFGTNNVTLSSVSLIPASNNTCGIGSSSNRFANIYGNVVSIGFAELSYDSNNFALKLSGVDGESDNPVGFEVDGTSFIDIGDARLVYDSGSEALHVTYKSGSGRTIGLFADGFVSSGGVAAQSTIRFVTVDGGNQIISGAKTFTGLTTFSSVVQLTGAQLESGPVLSVDGTNLESGAALSVIGDINVNGVTLSGSSTKLSISKNTEFSGISNVTGGKITIQSIVNRIIALENNS